MHLNEIQWSNYKTCRGGVSPPSIVFHPTDNRYRFQTFVETFHGTSLPPKIIRQFSNAKNTKIKNHPQIKWITWRWWGKYIWFRGLLSQKSAKFGQMVSQNSCILLCRIWEIEDIQIDKTPYPWLKWRYAITDNFVSEPHILFMLAITVRPRDATASQ